MGTYSKYDESFKRNAVNLVLSGQKAAQVARDLGLHVETLYQWVKKYRPASASAPARTGASTASMSGAASIELEALRKENELLKMERDILKKAVGIFSRPPK